MSFDSARPLSDKVGPVRQALQGHSSVRADGIFEFNNIQPGQYVAVLSRFDRQQPVTLGKTPVSVSSGHIDNLGLIANEPVALTGAVKVSGQAPADLTALCQCGTTAVIDPAQTSYCCFCPH